MLLMLCDWEWGMMLGARKLVRVVLETDASKFVAGNVLHLASEESNGT
jgi:hypothetical protein